MASSRPISGVTKYTNGTYQSGLRKVETSTKPASNNVPSLSLRKLDNEPANEKSKQDVSPSTKRPPTSRLSGRISNKNVDEEEDELAHTTGPSTISNQFTNSASNSNNKPSAAMTKVSYLYHGYSRSCAELEGQPL